MVIIAITLLDYIHLGVKNYLNVRHCKDITFYEGHIGLCLICDYDSPSYSVNVTICVRHISDYVRCTTNGYTHLSDFIDIYDVYININIVYIFGLNT